MSKAMSMSLWETSKEKLWTHSLNLAKIEKREELEDV